MPGMERSGRGTKGSWRDRDLRATAFFVAVRYPLPGSRHLGWCLTAIDSGAAGLHSELARLFRPVTGEAACLALARWPSK